MIASKTVCGRIVGLLDLNVIVYPETLQSLQAVTLLCWCVVELVGACQEH